MGDDMLSKISGILENPDALEKIKSIAADLGGVGGGDASSPSSSATAASTDLSGLLPGLNVNFDGARTLALLEAIRPFMRESRAAKVDTAIRAVRMMGVISKLK